MIVVNGDLVVLADNESDLQGVVYVKGDATIDGDFKLDGMLVVQGTLSIGHGSKDVVIRYDSRQIAMLKKALESYRMSRSVRPGWSR